MSKKIFAASLAAALLVAGCSAGGDGNNSPSDDKTPQPVPTTAKPTPGDEASPASEATSDSTASTKASPPPITVDANAQGSTITTYNPWAQGNSYWHPADNVGAVAWQPYAGSVKKRRTCTKARTSNNGSTVGTNHGGTQPVIPKPDNTSGLISELAKQKAAAKQKLAIAKAKAAKAKTAYDNANAELAALQAKLADLKDQYENFDAYKAASIEALSKQIKDIETQISEKKQALTQLQSNLDNARQQKQDAVAKISQAEQDSAVANAALQDAQAAVEAAQGGALEDLTDEQWDKLIAHMVAEKINAYRIKAGLHPLIVTDASMTQAAAWSKEMADNSPTMYEGHVHDPKNKEDNIGENILGNMSVKSKSMDLAAQGLFEQWRNSPGHNANMLNPEYSVMGLGFHSASKGRVFGTTKFWNYWSNDTVRVKQVKDQVDAGEAFLPSGSEKYVGADPAAGIDDVVQVTDDPRYDWSGKAASDRDHGTAVNFVDDLPEVGPEAVAKAQAEVDAAQADLVAAEELHAEGSAEKAAAEDAIQQAQNAIDQQTPIINNEIAELEAQQQAAETEKQEVTDSDISDVAAKIESTEVQIETAESNVDDAEDNLEAANAAVDQAQAELDALNNK